MHASLNGTRLCSKNSLKGSNKFFVSNEPSHPRVTGIFTLEIDPDVKYSPNHALDNKRDCTFALTRKESIADFEQMSSRTNSRRISKRAPDRGTLL
jgi:hypothetical protein